MHIETVFLIKSYSLCDFFSRQDVFLSQILSVQHPCEADCEGIAQEPPAAVRMQEHCGVSGRSVPRTVDVAFPSFCTVILCSSQGAVLAHVVLILSLDSLSTKEYLIFVHGQ